MKIFVPVALLGVALLNTVSAATCMVDGEVFSYCSNDLDGAWSFENGAVCVTEAECKKMSPPNGPISSTTAPPMTTARPPTTTTRTPPATTTRAPPATTTRTPPATTTKAPSSGGNKCMVDGEIFSYCSNDLDGAWSFENGAVCVTEAECKKMSPPNGPISSTTAPPMTTARPPATTTKAPTTPSTCTFDNEVFPICTATTDTWGFENGGVCISKSECEGATPSPTTSRPPTTTSRPPTTTSRPPTTTTRPPVTNSPPSGSAALYAQCGGSGYTGPTTCVAGARCNRQSDFYSQCIPDGSSPGNGNSGGAALWAQCGGNGYSGPTTCVSGARCNRSSEYYSQCIPA